MNFDTTIKTVIKFAPTALKLAQNERLRQLLKIAWHLYANRKRRLAGQTLEGQQGVILGQVGKGRSKKRKKRGVRTGTVRKRGVTKGAAKNGRARNKPRR